MAHSIRMETSPCCIQFYTLAIYNSYRWEHTLYDNGELSLLYEAAIYKRVNWNGHGRLFIKMDVYILFTVAKYNSCRWGTLTIRMEASPYCMQLLYTTHIEKARSLHHPRRLGRTMWSIILVLATYTATHIASILILALYTTKTQHSSCIQ